MEGEFSFNPPLEEGIIQSRPNRFIMIVKSGDSTIKCHCPSTGRIGDVVFKDVPCLLSKPKSQKERKTACTVEAISLDAPEKKEKSWIGINQTKVNSYLEHFIRTGQLEGLAGRGISDLKREVARGKSRIDFELEDALLEVKSPLTELPFSSNVKHKQLPPMSSFDRMIKHFEELTKGGGRPKRAILLLCYQFDAPPFKPPPLEKANEKIGKAAMDAERNGLETWQANLRIDAHSVSLTRYFRLRLFG